MTTIDLLLAPLYLLIIYALAYRHRGKYEENHPLRPYFIPALSIKLFGGILFAMVYQIYYKGGDTFWFFQGIEVLYEAFLENPAKGLELLTLDGYQYEGSTLIYTHKIWWFKDDNSYMVIKFGSVLSLFAFGNYTALTLLFSVFSFIGLWKLLKVFYDWMPQLHREFVISIFYIPSVFFWGSGIMKDTIMIGSFGIVVYCFYQIFYKKQRQIKYFLLLIFFSWIMLKIRSFVFFTLAPTLMFSLYVLYSNKIKSAAIRTVIAPFLLSIMAVGAVFVIQFTANINARYNLESLEKRAYDTQWWHTKVQELEGGEGSAYSLGPPTKSVPELAARFPLAVNVTFFRPYFWEVNGPIMLQSALESLIILIFALVTLGKTGITAFVRYPLKDPILAFAISFSILYAFGVGVTSNNFGALVRYKIPAIPMLISSLYMLRHYAALNKVRKLPLLAATEK